MLFGPLNPSMTFKRIGHWRTPRTAPGAADRSAGTSALSIGRIPAQAEQYACIRGTSRIEGRTPTWSCRSSRVAILLDWFVHEVASLPTPGDQRSASGESHRSGWAPERKDLPPGCGSASLEACRKDPPSDLGSRTERSSAAGLECGAGYACARPCRRHSQKKKKGGNLAALAPRATSFSTYQESAATTVVRLPPNLVLVL